MRRAQGARLVAGLAVALATGPMMIVGCGGSPYGARPARSVRPQTIPEPPPSIDPGISPDAVRARIETLDREIAARAMTLGFEPTMPDADGGPEPMAVPPTCTRSPRPVCQDVCSLSDSICDAADEICRLADALVGDAWAAGRCTAGHASCAQARARCCGC